MKTSIPGNAIDNLIMRKRDLKRTNIEECVVSAIEGITSE